VGRKLILCFDGTNNAYATTNTNVVKLYAMLDRSKDDQLAYYQPGIGTSPPPGIWGKAKKWIITRFDLAIAWLLEQHVTDGYRFLMRYYREGDQIFIFGFSRGAYTARALAAMVHKVGLLSQGNEELIPFAWAQFEREGDWEESGGFRKTFCRKVPIEFLGLWDTVSSVGWLWHPQYLEFTANNPSVKVVRHALALDERRSYFVQNLWGHDPTTQTNVEQVWFAGVHCDVGGGYAEAESGLAKLALQWMVAQSRLFGLRFDPATEAIILPAVSAQNSAAPDVTAVQHESLRGWWWLAEFVPKQIKDPSVGFKSRWIIHWGRHRYVAAGAKIHASVLQRHRRISTYAPDNLPAQYIETS
jgi:uncharacterized protein (DUF2235 family)